MPVLGHALVGLAIGMCTKPSREVSSSSGSASFAYALWVPVAVALAYLPDVTGQLILVAGWSEARAMSHSVLFAIVASGAIAPALARMVQCSPRRVFVLALVSVLVHDLLDLAQATDRMLWWPLSRRHVVLGFAPIPTEPSREALVFGFLFAVFLGCRRVAASVTAGRGPQPPPPSDPPTPLAWVGRGAIVLIMLAATLTHYLRATRERQLEDARTLLETRSYQRALETLDQAERWPSTAKSGRIDYVRAEAYAGIGDRQRAESHYLRAYHADPTYFWAVADLALFYASSDAPLAERRRLIAPYLHRLKSEFTDHWDLPRTLATLERKLAPPPDPDPRPTESEHAAPRGKPRQ